tara:strand:- start:303 stop:512 length:210 start_codon:yes stop_codon:yes gene_type:complete
MNTHARRFKQERHRKKRDTKRKYKRLHELRIIGKERNLKPKTEKEPQPKYKEKDLYFEKSKKVKLVPII